MFDADIYKNYNNFAKLLSSFIEFETDGFDVLEKVKIIKNKNEMLKEIDDFFKKEDIKPNSIVSNIDKYFSYSEFLKYANIYFPNTLILANLLEDYFGNNFLSILYNSYVLEPDKNIEYNYSENENMVDHNLIMFSFPDRDFEVEAFQDKVFKKYYEPIFEDPLKYGKYPNIDEGSSLEDLKRYLNTMEFLSENENYQTDNMRSIYINRLNEEINFRGSYLAREDVKEDFISIMLNVKDLEDFVDYLFDKKILSSNSKNLFEDSILISNSIDDFKEEDKLSDIISRQIKEIDNNLENNYFIQREIPSMSNQSLKYQNIFDEMNKIIKDFDLSINLSSRDISILLENFDKIKEKYSAGYIDIAGRYNDIKTQMLLLNKGMIYPVIYEMFLDDNLKDDLRDIAKSSNYSYKMSIFKLDLLDRMRINDRNLKKRYAPTFKEAYKENLKELKRYIEDVEDYNDLLREKDEINKLSNMIYYKHIVCNINIDIANANRIKYTPLVDSIMRIRMGNISIENNISMYHIIPELNKLIGEIKTELPEKFPIENKTNEMK